MACEKRPYLCAILVLGILALFFHLVGFVTPGWLIMRRSVLEEEASIFEVEGQRIDDGGLIPPGEKPIDDDDIMARRRRDDHHGGDHPPHHGGDHPPNHGGDHRPHHGGDRPPPHHGGPDPHHGETKDDNSKDEDMRKENAVVEEWMMQVTAEIKVYDVRTSYGLWYSTVCVHDKNFDDNDSEEKHKDEDHSNFDDKDSSDSDDHDDDDKKGHCRCKKISTKCALYYSFIYEDPIDFINPGGPAKRVLSNKNFGYASLTEHRVENSVALVFLVLGLISAIGGFRKVNGCRCAALACVVFMLLAAFIAIVPVARLSHYSVNKTSQRVPVKVHAPYSVIATGLGAIFALITALVAGCALMMKSRKQEAGKWYQFNNELELPNEKKEKPALVFYADALPEKAGLYDVCDFGDLKPVEEVKKSEPEEDADEFVL